MDTPPRALAILEFEEQRQGEVARMQPGRADPVPLITTAEVCYGLSVGYRYGVIERKAVVAPAESQPDDKAHCRLDGNAFLQEIEGNVHRLTWLDAEGF